MTQFTARSARKFMAIKAAKRLVKEIEQAGLDNLKVLAGTGISIVGTYLQGSSAQKQREIRQELAALTAFGVTPNMLLDEVAKQMPDLAQIMAGKEDYRKSELQRIEQFLLTTD